MSDCIVPEHLPLNDAGYRLVFIRKDVVERAHRMAYKLLVGPIGRHNHLHHLCGNKECMNVEHLEVVSNSEHRQRHLVKLCKRGHDEWYIRPDGKGRQCMACQREQSRKNRSSYKRMEEQVDG